MKNQMIIIYELLIKYQNNNIILIKERHIEFINNK